MYNISEVGVSSTSAWGDLMTFDGTNYITYDEIGNPTSIYQDEGSFTHGYELTWEGRQLTAYTYFEDSFKDTPTTYTYNADGIRTGKTTYSGTEYEYTLDGSRIISQTWDNKIFVFVYDENGSPIGINYAIADPGAFDYFSSYYFEKNMQGDIIAVYNSAGTKIGTYTYDAWGNVTQTILSTNSTDKLIMNNNPFRYRGYYYDTDTKFYYLQTRYYNPANGRFLNADGYVSTGTGLLGHNMFAYCNNNPVMYVDYTGELFLKIVLLVVVVVVVGLTMTSSEKQDEEYEPEEDLTVSTTSKYYDTIDDAARAWGDKYSAETAKDHKERGAIIYSKVIDGKRVYYTGVTIKGFESTCWNSFIFGHFLGNDTIEGFIHSHTAYPRSDGTWDTKDLGPSDADLWLFNIPWIKRQYIVDENNNCYEFDSLGHQRNI